MEDELLLLKTSFETIGRVPNRLGRVLREKLHEDEFNRTNRPFTIQVWDLLNFKAFLRLFAYVSQLYPFVLCSSIGAAFFDCLCNKRVVSKSSRKN